MGGHWSLLSGCSHPAEEGHLPSWMETALGPHGNKLGPMKVWLGPKIWTRASETPQAGAYVLISEPLFHQSSVPPSCSPPSSATLNHQDPLNRPSVQLDLSGITLQKSPSGPRLSRSLLSPNLILPAIPVIANRWQSTASIPDW